MSDTFDTVGGGSGSNDMKRGREESDRGQRHSVNTWSGANSIKNLEGK